MSDKQTSGSQDYPAGNKSMDAFRSSSAAGRRLAFSGIDTASNQRQQQQSGYTLQSPITDPNNPQFYTRSSSGMGNPVNRYVPPVTRPSEYTLQSPITDASNPRFYAQSNANTGNPGDRYVPPSDPSRRAGGY